MNRYHDFKVDEKKQMPFNIRLTIQLSSVFLILLLTLALKYINLDFSNTFKQGLKNQFYSDYTKEFNKLAAEASPKISNFFTNISNNIPKTSTSTPVPKSNK